MNTVTNPKNLSSLKYEEHVLETSSFAIEAKASEYFKVFMDDKRPVKCNHIFTEDGYKVFECYTDSGSTDYLYIIKRN